MVLRNSRLHCRSGSWPCPWSVPIVNKRTPRGEREDLTLASPLSHRTHQSGNAHTVLLGLSAPRSQELVSTCRKPQVVDPGLLHVPPTHTYQQKLFISGSGDWYLPPIIPTSLSLDSLSPQPSSHHHPLPMKTAFPVPSCSADTIDFCQGKRNTACSPTPWAVLHMGVVGFFLIIVSFDSHKSPRWYHPPHWAKTI